MLYREWIIGRQYTKQWSGQDMDVDLDESGSGTGGEMYIDSEHVLQGIETWGEMEGDYLQK